MSVNGGIPNDPFRPVVRPMFRSLGIASSGLSAQRLRMETAATNIANAETTRTEEGGPFRRRVVELAARAGEGPYQMTRDGVPAEFRLPSGAPIPGTAGVEIEGVVEDMTEGPLVYDPGHPDADDMGYVRYPNVRVTDELIDVMNARRLYEANATVFQSVRSMLRSAIDI